MQSRVTLPSPQINIKKSDFFFTNLSHWCTPCRTGAQLSRPSENFFGKIWLLLFCVCVLGRDIIDKKHPSEYEKKFVCSHVYLPLLLYISEIIEQTAAQRHCGAASVATSVKSSIYSLKFEPRKLILLSVSGNELAVVQGCVIFLQLAC